MLCQMLRSREFLLVRNVSHSGKYKEQSTKRKATLTVQVWVDTKEKWSSAIITFPFASTFLAEEDRVALR